MPLIMKGSNDYEFIIGTNEVSGEIKLPSLLIETFYLFKHFGGFVATCKVLGC